VASPAAASPETLRRAMSNILFAPFDVALSPVVAATSVYRNLRSIDDSLGVRIVYVVPGYIWNVGLQAGTGVIRAIAGGLELVPGIFLVPFDLDMTPLFAPAEKASAMVDIDTPPLSIKFGIDYSSIPY
jgi:hypothetical protein